MGLRPYQKKCNKQIFNEFNRGVKSQLVELPTGTGKTVIFVSVVRDASWPSLVLVHRDELARQTIAKLQDAGFAPGDVGIMMGDTNDIGRQITVGSVQTLSRGGGSRLEELLKYIQPRLIVVDEAHHAAAKSYRSIIDRVHPDLLVGFTATPTRLDKKHLVGDVFEKLVFRRSILEMVMAGYLTTPVRKIINTETSLDWVAVQGGDFSRGELGRAVDDDLRRERIVDAWLKHAQGRKTIVFAVDVTNAEKLAEAFRSQGIDAKAIHGKMSKSQRQGILEEYADRCFDVLVNVDILTEGFDDPETDCVLMARPTLSAALYIQMIGRSLRLYDGKDDALIIDVTDNSRRHSIGFQDIMPEARDPHELLREMPRAQLEFFNDMQSSSSGGERGKNGWFTGDPSDFEDLGIFHDPHFRWIKHGDEGFSLAIGKGESVHLVKGALTGNIVALSDKKEWIVENPIPPQYAFAVAEQWAMDRSKQIGLKKPYGWTQPGWWDLFATDKQTEFAKRLGIKDIAPKTKMAVVSYRIDEKTLRPKFASVLGWLDRNMGVDDSDES